MTREADGGTLPEPRTSTRTTWSAGPLWPLTQILLGLAAVGLLVTSGSPGAFLLYGIAAALLLAGGIGHLARRPRLEVVDDTLILARLRGRTMVPRERVVEVRVLPLSRIGRRTHVLRVEHVDEHGEEHLEVLTRTDLGTDPRDVLATLLGRGFPGRESEL